MAAAGTPLLTVMDMSKVVARVNMAQDQARNVKVGNEATITPADGGELVTGRVTIVSPASDANSTRVSSPIDRSTRERWPPPGRRC